MSARTIPCVILVACLVSAAAADQGSDAPGPSAPTPREKTPREAIERALTLIDLVLEHHIEPPTRQEMILHGAQSLYRAGGIAVPRKLARQVSELQGREATVELLSVAWSAASAQSLPTGALREVLAGGVLAPAPGNAHLLPTKEFRVQEQLQANRYVGIGIALGSHEDSGFTRIASLFAGGPAARTGAAEGDQIEAIDGRSTQGLAVTEVVDRIRGPEGSVVTIVFRQPGAEARTLEITRGVVPRRTVFGWKREEPDLLRVTQGIACVRLADIGGSIVHELRQVEEQLQSQKEIQALVIDLRNNDGSAHPAAMLADALLSEGVIGRVRKTDRTQELTADAECLFRGLPLAVLVDRTTGNAGEWVAAALQDNRRALVVGEPTSGRAYVHGGIELTGEENSLVLPEGILERPSGKPLLRHRTAWEADEETTVWRDGARQPPLWNWGVWPDHVVGRMDLRVQSGRTTAARREPNVLPAPVQLAVPHDPILSKACDVLAEQLKNRTQQTAK